MARRLFTCALAALLGSAPALAPRADDDARAKPSFGEEVEVVGKRPRGAAADPTAAATVVEASRFAGEAKSVAELVATAPGVAVNGYGGLGQLATISIRGSTADEVQVFLDGLPLNTAAGGGVDLSRIPRAWIQRIEVVRGAEGAVYGAGALGGAVNIVTRAPSQPRWSAEASGASFTTASVSAELARGDGHQGVLASISLDRTGGRYPYEFDPTPNTPGGASTVDRVNNASTSGALLAKGYLAVGEGRLDAALQLSGGRREIPGNVFALTRDDAQRDGRVGGIARWSTPLGDAVRASFQGTLRAENLDITAPSIGITSRQRDIGGVASARFDWSAGPHALSADATAGGERLASEGTGIRSRAVLALALGDDVALGGGVHVAPTVRAERAGGFTGWSAKLGASAPLGGPFSSRASIGRTFRAPSFAELYLQQPFSAPNPALAPEIGWSADAALRAEGRAGVATLGAFWTRYADVIVYLPSVGLRVKPFNAGEADARGAEAEVASAPIGAVRASAQLAYTLLLTDTLRGAPGNAGHELPHRARHRAYARVGIAPDPIAAHAEVQYVGAQWQDLRSLLAIPATTILNAGGSLRLLRNPDLRVHLEVRNVLDDRTLTDGFLNPLPGRMVMVTVGITGGKDDST